MMKKLLLPLLCLLLLSGIPFANAQGIMASVEGEQITLVGEEQHGDFSPIGGPMFALQIAEGFYFSEAQQVGDREGPMYLIAQDDEGVGPVSCEIRFLPATTLAEMTTRGVFASYGNAPAAEPAGECTLGGQSGENFFAYDGQALYTASLVPHAGGVLAVYTLYEASDYVEGIGAHLTGMLGTFRFTE